MLSRRWIGVLGPVAGGLVCEALAPEVEALTAGGTLTAAERAALQSVADEFGTEIEVVGSRAAGAGRNIDTDLPVGKGPGTRSDIDVRIDSQVDIDSSGGLSDQLKNIGGGNLVDVRTRLPGGSYAPVITITPKPGG